MISILLPHKRNPGNNYALRICIDMLMTNTVNDFVLLLDAAVDAPLYPRVNRLFVQAQTDLCIYWASDMFPSPGWDVPMIEAWRPGRIVTNTVVEPGAIAMHGQNLHRDFGRTPDQFQRAAFEQWCLDDGVVMDGEGWFAPYLIDRGEFLYQGGLDEDVDAGLEFGGADMALFAKFKDEGGEVVRAPDSWVYHLQRWSDVEEQEAEKRR